MSNKQGVASGKIQGTKQKPSTKSNPTLLNNVLSAIFGSKKK